MSEPVHTIILSEDLQLRCFIRRFLIRRGWHSRQIYEVPLPSGGAGVAWLREKLPDEIQAYRSRNARAKTCLIVGCDADADTVEDRLRLLARSCAESGVPFRQDGEDIAFTVPRRNIETWLAYLRGQVVNEVDVYPKYAFESECRSQVVRLDEMCRIQNLQPEPPPPSLLFACEEFRRISS